MFVVFPDLVKEVILVFHVVSIFQLLMDPLLLMLLWVPEFYYVSKRFNYVLDKF